MSAENVEIASKYIDPAEQAIETLLHRKWHDYYPDPSDQAEDTEKQLRAAQAIHRAQLIAIEKGEPRPLSIGWREEPSDELPSSDTLAIEADRQRQSSEIIQRLTNEVFKPFNSKVGEAMGASLQTALDILAPLAVRHAKDPASEGYQAFANYYIMLLALSSNFALDTPLLSEANYGITSFPTELDANLTHAYRDGSQTNTYRLGLKGYFGSREMQDIDAEGKRFAYGFLRQSVDLAMRTQPGVRAAFSLERHDSTRQLLSQNVQSHTTGKTRRLEDFSIRLDKDKAFATGFSLDIGRDTKDNAALHRPGDVVGKALQAARPEYGSHFPEHFEGVTDADFDEFISNLSKFLRADVELAQLDRALRHYNDLNDAARWENPHRWPTQPGYMPPLTRGNLGKLPFGPPKPKADQKQSA